MTPRVPAPAAAISPISPISPIVPISPILPILAISTILAASLATSFACVGPGAFPCHEDQQCRAAGSSDGFCESTGSCSFLDSACQPSGRRYGAHAAAALAGNCVEDACPNDPVMLVRAGASHACVVRAGGQVACWGAGTDGQLGDGTMLSRSTIAIVPGLGAVRDVALGDRHTCAVLTADGSVWCWGANDDGQLGDGSRVARATPAAVPGLAGVIGVAAGASFTCALQATGIVACWGQNADGELGIGAASDSVLTPQPIPAITNARALTARDRHACAVLGDDVATGSQSAGPIVCWGSNAEGELGIGSVDPQATPTPLPGFTGRATAIAAGVAHTCALDDGGQLWCWGTNQLGEVGDGTDEMQLAPRAVSLPVPATALAAGAHHTCVRESDATVWCWGANQAGQLGEGTTTNIDVPVPATGIEDATDVAAGASFSCTHKRDGTIWCWGDDRLGQLGTGAAIERLSPVRVSSLSGALSLTAGGTHTCARKPASGGAAATVCWGDNQAGEIGDGTRIDRATPVPLKIGLDARDVAAGALHTCLRGGDGSVWCWGRGSSGQLGAPTAIDTVVPTVVPGFTGATAIAAGTAHTCALQMTTALCWGANDDGQLGDGTTTSRATPAVVSGAGDVVELALGGTHTCARRSDGTVTCWGRGDDGQLGDRNQTSSPIPVVVANLAAGSDASLAGVVSLAAGDRHTCAVLADGSAACWGAGDKGQLGWGSAEPRPLPAAVMHIAGAVEIVAGANHTCARVSPDGQRDTPGNIYCWGDNRAGQLGNGTRMSWPVPAQTPVVDGAIGLAAGDAHTCALLSDRSVVCWGSEAAGQLGDGATLQSPTAQPTRIACP